MTARKPVRWAELQGGYWHIVGPPRPAIGVAFFDDEKMYRPIVTDGQTIIGFRFKTLAAAKLAALDLAELAQKWGSK